jgi:hypothetical protein
MKILLLLNLVALAVIETSVYVHLGITGEELVLVSCLSGIPNAIFVLTFNRIANKINKQEQ